MSKLNMHMVDLIKRDKKKELGESYYNTTWIPKIDKMIDEYNSNEDPSLLEDIKVELGYCSNLIVGEKTNNILLVLPKHYKSDVYMEKLHKDLRELRPECTLWYYSNTGFYSIDDILLACVKHGYDACYIDPVIAISELFGIHLILTYAIPGIDIILKDMNGELINLNIDRGGIV